MAFTGDEGEMIDPALGQKWIDNYRNKVKSDPKAIFGEFYGFRKIEELVGQTGAVGIRIYYAIDDTGTQRMILVGTDANQNDIAPIAGSKGQGLVLDVGFQCPPKCNGPCGEERGRNPAKR